MMEIDGRDRGNDEKKSIKCVAWDLDDTMWQGVLLEDRRIRLRDNVAQIIKQLDDRGILQSVVSRNDYDVAMAKLREVGLSEYFLYPQICWGSKAQSIKRVAESLNIGLDAMAFIDDQQFELEEVRSTNPEVLCINAAEIDRLLEMPEMNPRFITEDSKMRRLMYAADIRRKTAEAEFDGPKEEFLATLDMIFTIGSATEDDLRRAEELTIRTNQLNTTGYTYSYEELDSFRKSDRHELLIADLTDRYGSYSKIGLALIEHSYSVWTIKLLLMSCRVMSRGVGGIMINHIVGLAKRKGVRLQAYFISNDRNRMMYITYKLAGFNETKRMGDVIILEHDLSRTCCFPEYVKVKVLD